MDSGIKLFLSTFYFSVFCITFLLPRLFAASISGNINYQDEQSGPIYVQAWNVENGNMVMTLDGDGDFASVPVMNISGSELTIQYWFKGSSIQSAVRQQDGNYMVAGWNNLHILSNDGGTGGGISAGNVTDGEWHHVLFTWKQGEENGFASYLDGKLVESRTAGNNPIPEMSNPVHFGSFNGISEFAAGSFDEIAIFSKFMSPDDVQENWFKKLKGNEDDLIGYWNFDDETVDDQSPNEFHGELWGDAFFEEATIPGLDGFGESVLEVPTAFTIADIDDSNYNVFAFMDVNSNGFFDFGEPNGFASDNPIGVSGDLGNINILLSEPPSMISNPSDAILAAGSELSLSVSVSGSNPLNFSWKHNGETIENNSRTTGADTANLQISDLRGGDAGAYSCEISNAAGTVFSDVAFIEVIANAVEINGTISYEGSQTGPILISAIEKAPENLALSLDGNGDTAITTLLNLFGDQITISYWFKGSSIQSAVRQQSAGWVVAGWNGMHILSHDGGTSGISAGESVTDGNWHHVAMTWKRDQEDGFVSYLDGKVVTRRRSSAVPIPDHQAQVYFGSFNGASEFTNGMLDEIAIYERSLSESDIAGVWNKRLTGEEDGIIGFWNFDDTVDGIAPDLSGFFNDAELIGDASVEAVQIPGLGANAFQSQLNQIGNYKLSPVAKANDYEITAFMDVNGNGVHDDGEPFGAYSDNPLDISTNLNDINIELTEPPRIVRQSGDARAPEGGTITLKAYAEGSLPLEYQWYQWHPSWPNSFPLSDGDGVTGAETDTLSIAGIDEDNEVFYFAIVTNEEGQAQTDNSSVFIINNGQRISGDIKYSGATNTPIIIATTPHLVGNKALRIDGDGDYAVIPDLTDLSGEEISISYNFKGESIQSAVRQQSGSGYIVAGWNNMHILSNDGGTSGLSAGVDVTDGQWHHVIFTWQLGEEDGFRTYLDGELIESRDAGLDPIPFIDAPVHFGAFNGASEFASGMIDEISIWNVAIPGDIIAQEYDEPVDGDEENLIGFWNFNDGSVLDVSGNGLDGELHGDAEIIDVNIPGFGADVYIDSVTPGEFSLENVPQNVNYHMTAFADLNGNGNPDEGEPLVEYAGNPFDLGSDLSEVVIDLGGPDSPSTPELIIDQIEGEQSVTLSWNPEETGFSLYQSESIAPGNWQIVNDVENNQVTVTISESNMFFRLLQN